MDQSCITIDEELICKTCGEFNSKFYCKKCFIEGNFINSESRLSRFNEMFHVYLISSRKRIQSLLTLKNEFNRYNKYIINKSEQVRTNSTKLIVLKDKITLKNRILNQENERLKNLKFKFNNNESELTAIKYKLKISQYIVKKLSKTFLPKRNNYTTNLENLNISRENYVKKIFYDIFYITKINTCINYKFKIVDILDDIRIIFELNLLLIETIFKIYRFTVNVDISILYQKRQLTDECLRNLIFSFMRVFFKNLPNFGDISYFESTVMMFNYCLCGGNFENETENNLQVTYISNILQPKLHK